MEQKEDDTKTKKREARYYSDLQTIESPDFQKYIRTNYNCSNGHPKELSEIGYAYGRILPENYEKWVLEKSKSKDYSDIQDEVLKLIFKQAYSRASELIVEWIESNYYIYTTKDDKSSEIWFYENGIYVPNGRSEIKEICREILQEYFIKTVTGQVINKIEADTYIDSTEFFKTNYKYEIPMQNGILNVLTKELSPYTPSKIFFNKMPVFYDTNAKCPLIDKFLSDVLAYPEDKVVYYEVAGFGLVKEYIMEKAIMMVGNGRNGKGKSLELLKRMVGIENCSSLGLISLTPDSFSLNELFGKLYNLAGDLSSIALKDTGMFKSLTGRDIVSARRKFLRDIIFTNHAKFIFACNELPKVYDYSIGFWERWILLEYPYRFVEQEVYDNAKPEERALWKIKDDSIIDKVSTPEELSGLLNEALNGLDRVLKNKKFSYSKGTEEIKNTWIRRSDSFMAFCMDMLEEDPEGKIYKKDMRRLFSKYCKQHKVKGVSDKSMKATLQEMFGVGEEYVVNPDGYQINAWVGIKWK